MNNQERHKAIPPKNPHAPDWRSVSLSAEHKVGTARRPMFRRSADGSMGRHSGDVPRELDGFLAEVEEPNAEEILESVMAACALIAYADGRVTPEERLRMLSVIPRFTALRYFSDSELSGAFEAATGWFEAAPADGKVRALEAIGRVRRHQGCRVPLLRACHAIATADRRFDRREREALADICGALGLDPGEYGLKQRV